MSIDLEEARTGFIRGSLGGFAFLLTNGIGWLIMGAAFLWSSSAGIDVRWPALALIFLGAITTPASFIVQKALNLPAPSTSNPIPLLAVALALVQTLALPAPIVVWNIAPAFVAPVWASIVGAHFLPYAWMQRTRWYVSLAILVPASAWFWAIALGAGASAPVCLTTGGLMIAWSVLIRMKSRRLPAA